MAERKSRPAGRHTWTSGRDGGSEETHGKRNQVIKSPNHGTDRPETLHELGLWAVARVVHCVLRPSDS